MAARSWFYRLFLTALLALAAVMVAGVITLRWDHQHAVTLPRPSGPYPVGRTRFTWVKPVPTKGQQPQTNGSREVAVWLWYPAAPTAASRPADYMPATWRKAFTDASGFVMSQLLTRDLSLVHAHSYRDPPVSPKHPSYPVILMRPGGSALTTSLTTLAEDLASHGYFVVGFDVPYLSTVVVLPDSSVIHRSHAASLEGSPPEKKAKLAEQLLHIWTHDAGFVVDRLDRLNHHDPAGRFTGRLDLNRIGAFGHSFGGAQALQFCHVDERCKAGMDIDGIPFGSVAHDGIEKPVMFLLSDHGNLAAGDNRQAMDRFASIYKHLPPDRLFLYIQGTNHFSFSDQVYLKSRMVMGLIQWVLHETGKRRALAITSAYIHTFFDTYLNGVPPGALEGLQEHYPEVHRIRP